jgi:outer membrane cobalamin receptor
VPFQVPGICAATSDAFDSCTDHVWAYNPEAALTYTSETAGTLFVAFVHKSRFPTIKDRYSCKAGRAVPNPTLDPERARTWTAGYSRTIASKTVAQVDLFRSDAATKSRTSSSCRRCAPVAVVAASDRVSRRSTSAQSCTTA